MTTFLMIIGACMVGLGFGLMNSRKSTPKGGMPKKNLRYRKDDDFWEYVGL
ncbi:hypothetical protein SAMN05216354_0357 [Xylanibacter ruminicola]|uniref:Uncharacterized protein n=1 Tax=Xylanibacter ruminicola TaxID=839 RepID=A0A1H5RXS6_XYLRU|nr:hypothetical protein [Xylanibacter ruminicola]SEF42301.1 hypothetical protein SAMN05216354_0357 [Xylanibacter ruminicola]